MKTLSEIRTSTPTQGKSLVENYTVHATRSENKQTVHSHVYSTLPEAQELMNRMAASNKFSDMKIVGADGSEVKEEAEGEMAMGSGVLIDQLDTIADMADEIGDVLYDMDNVPSWVEENIQQASDLINEIYSAIEDDSETDQEDSEIEREDSEEAAEETESDSQVVSESFICEEIDINKFKTLARMGLVDKNKISAFVAAFQKMNNDGQLSRSQALMIADLMETLFGIITGDSSIYQKVRRDIATPDA